mmetsp:Transcript_9254/g.22944  ORF Transcript_9254/g.22944 Transcript_9254/m.22944 type:complete len:387 (+) Transcript_9254:230-1390(+)
MSKGHRWPATCLLRKDNIQQARREMLMPYSPPVWARGLQITPSHYVAIGQLNTEVQQWHLGEDLVPEGFDLLIKRDDKTGIGLSGNKVRKLQFLMAEAIDIGADCVVTIGGTQSNHCRATAVAATKLGLESYLILREHDAILDAEPDPGITGNLLLSRLVGANMCMVSKSEYVSHGQDSLLLRKIGMLKAAGKTPYGIPVGGSSPLGCWGYIEFVRELKEQLDAAGDSVSDIVVAMGSGGSAAGIALANKMSGLGAKVHAVIVCDNKDYFVAQVQQTFDALGANYKAQDLLEIHEGYKGKGYAVSSEQELRTIVDVAKMSGIMCDPVYNGKALCGLLDLLKNQPGVFQGKRLLFVHTGGLYGFYDKEEQLMPLLSARPVTRLLSKM